MMESASRWLVGSSSSSVVACGEQDPGQLHPAPLTAGQRAQRLLQYPLRQAEAGGDAWRPASGRVAVAGKELGLGVLVAAHRLVPGGGIRGGHPLGRHAQAAVDLHQIASAEDPVARQHVEVAGARVLRQVADLAAARHRARGRLALAGQHPGQRGLAGAVATDETDSVAGPDPEARRLQQQPGSDPQFHALGCQHVLQDAWRWRPIGKRAAAHAARADPGRGAAAGFRR